MRNILRVSGLLLILFTPMTSYSVTPAGTIIRNGGDKGTMTIADMPGDVILTYSHPFIQATTTTQNVASTTVRQGYGLAPLVKFPAQLLGGSRTIYFTYTLTNTGNGTDTVSLTSSLMAGTWSVRLIEDTNQDEVHQPTETTAIGSITLLQEQSKYIFLEVVVPEGDEGESVTAKIRAKSAGTDTWGMPDTQVATITCGFDVTPPKIQHAPMTKIGMIGNKVVISGTITDGTVVERALLYGTASTNIIGSMTTDFNPCYSYTISPDLIGTAGITYQIWATDGLNATTTQDYQIEVCLTTVGTITQQGGEVVIPDGNPEDGETSIIIPENEVGGPVSITQKAIEEAPDSSGNFLIQSDEPAVFYQFEAPSNKFTQEVTITMLYLDVDNDGKEDITGADELTLKVFYWNDEKQEWELIGGQIDPIKNTITIAMTHLSQFAIFPSKKPAANRLSNVFVYPNPCYTNRNCQLTFAGLTADVTIRIFNVAGELVRTLQKNDKGEEKEWDLRNDDGEKVASGIYIYLVIDDDTGEKVTGKLGVLR